MPAEISSKSGCTQISTFCVFIGTYLFGSSCLSTEKRGRYGSAFPSQYNSFQPSGSARSRRGSLDQIRAKPDVVIPLPIRYLEENDVKEAAAQALGEYGSRSNCAVPKLPVSLLSRKTNTHLSRPTRSLSI